MVKQPTFFKFYALKTEYARMI